MGQGGVVPQVRLISVNERLVMDLLLESGPLARPEIARRASLSKPATRDLVQRLLDRGLVVEAGAQDTGQRGPNAMSYAVRPELGHVAGVEMQPSHVRVAVADFTGATLAEVEQTVGDEPPADRVAAAVDAAARSAGLAGGADLASVVIATPGVVGPAGDLDFVSGHDDWAPGLGARLQQAVGAPVRLENDINLAAVAEHRVGAARAARSFALVRCDAGIGAGFVLDGRPLRGAHGYAGELGYVPLDGRQRNPEEGFQALVGRASLVELLGRMGGGADPEHTLAHPEGVVGEQFLAAVAERLSLVCLTVCAVLDPERIVLAGSVVAAGADRLTDEITRLLHERSPMRPSVVAASQGASAAVTGALLTALDDVRDAVLRVSVDPVAVRGVPVGGPRRGSRSPT